MWCVVKLVLIFVAMCVARESSDEELHRLPKLFHLDDYERCLSQKEGVYCLGTFELMPTSIPNAAYDIITEQLKQHFSFDRRLLHRGYCLSKRCQSGEQNTTLGFEQCVDRLLQKSYNKHALKARLKKLSYCTTHTERKAKLSQAPDLPQRVFLYVLYLLLFLNVLGTVHDVYGNGKKNKLLAAWSIPANWRALTTIDDGNSLFAPIQSSKIILHCIIIYTHANLLHFMGYMHNPEAVEKSRDSFVNVLIRNGTSLVQVFILISSFFTGYNVLETARRSSLGTALAAKWILKRIFRLAPVYLLVTAYSATWWPRAGDGPLWSIVEEESQVCRRKFWTHLLFINNFVEPSELCMVQSWAIAAEVQLFLVSLLLTLLVMKLKVRAVPVLGAMFAASCLFNVTLAYVAGLVPMVKVIVPETLRNEFRGSRSFFHLHTSPWSNFPACLFGLLVAHVYFEQKYKIKAKPEDRKETYENIPNGLKQENKNKIKENYGLVNGNARFVENGKLVNGNGTLVNENGIRFNENGTHLNENALCVNENNVLNNGNSGLVIKNGVHGNENGAHVYENGTHVNGIDVRAENGLKHRKYTVDDRKYNGINNTDINIENKSKCVMNAVINQNGQSNGYGNQNGLTLENKDKKFKKTAPLMLRYAHCFTLPILIAWVVFGSRVSRVESPLAAALYVGLERLMFSLTFACQLLQVITVKGPWATLLSWRGWALPARLVLSVAVVHWCVNATLLSARPHPVASSILSVSIDWLATLIYSYIIALPLSILVELPMKKTLDALIS